MTARLGIHSVRFSKEFFEDRTVTEKWMLDNEYNTSSVLDLRGNIDYLQLAKNRFIAPLFQSFDLDAGVVAMVGILRDEQETNFDNIQDQGELVLSSGPTDEQLTALKDAFSERFDLFKAILEIIISLSEPHMQVKDLAVNDLIAVVDDSTSQVSKMRSRLNTTLVKRREVPDGTVEVCDVSFYVPIFKAEDEEERIVYGEVLVPNEFDAEEDIYAAVDIKKAAHYWMEQSNGSIGLMHETLIDDQVSVLETFLAPVTFSVTKADGTKRKIKKGTWLLKIRLHDDDLWEQAQTEELTGFSIGGVAQVESLNND